MAITAAVGGFSALQIRKRMHHRNANWLRNDEGVGPTHYRGTHRGNEFAVKRTQRQH